MKTEQETQIAKENVERLNNDNYFYQTEKARCVEHLSTLKRWLEFTNKIYCQCGACYETIPKSDLTEEKLTDIRNAIAIYELEDLK